MKIDSGVKSMGAAVAGKQPAVADQARRQPESVEPTRVDISSLSARLQVDIASVENESGIDAARVAEIKQAITEGRFSINPEKIANGLLQSVSEMLSKGR